MCVFYTFFFAGNMKKNYFFLAVYLFCAVCVKAQLLTWSPQFPNDNSSITVTVDATQGNKALQGFLGKVYMHLGVITSQSNFPGDWKYVPTTWGTTTAPQATSLGNNKWSFTINNPRTYFNSAAGGVPAGEAIFKVALLFRDSVGNKVQKNADGSDMYIPIYPAGSNAIIFTRPLIAPTYNLSNENIIISAGQSVALTAVASSAAGTLRLYLDGTAIAGPLTGTNTISATPTVSATGNHQLVAELSLAGTSYYDTIKFFIPKANTVLALPPNVKDGINYFSGCDSVTFVLYAPNKQNAVLIGDFEAGAWSPQTKYQMNKTPDGNYYWLTLKGLTPGFEYSFQYLVDNSIYIADPYCEKILDPWNDPFIPTATYPGLKPYPADPNVSSGQNGLVGIFQTCSPQYEWKEKDFVRPDKRNLVIYELLVRDFGNAKNYQMLIDTMSYFRRLGINAIELMPVNEFSGNESWGYNPTFYLALDKAYGTKDKFKEFVDTCHRNGIAVILDVVYNQLDAFNTPIGKLYWDAANNRPAANNPWLNPTATHPYSVFEDMNHTSVPTQNLVKRAIEYWISEYHVDGYRFDLAKGFSQKITNTTTVEEYDQQRVDNLKRYYDYIVPKYPGIYMILEFLAQQRPEEQAYANHGFMLWTKCTDQYNQATMGFATGSDFSKVIYNSSQSAFSSPAAVGYMESHDEERLAFKNVTYGTSSGSYNVKDTATSLVRLAAAAAVFLTTPGPKMIWQFGERGYDKSIESNGGRVANKPPLWEYMNDQRRLRLWRAYARLINLRTSFADLFNSANFSYDFYDNFGLVKRLQINDNTANGIRINVVANLDLTAQTRTLNFSATGQWVNYLSNGTSGGLNGATGITFNVASANQSITLQPGEYHVYLYQPANVYTFIGSGNWTDATNWLYNKVPPAILPAGSEIVVNTLTGGECVLNTSQTISNGAKFTVVGYKKIKIPLNLSIQ